MAKNKHGNICCEGCGSYHLRATVSYDGCDWRSKAGDGSGFEFLVALECEDCGRIYPVIRLKDEFAVSQLKEPDEPSF